MSHLVPLLNYLPPEWRDKAIIAGGYPAAPTLASDIDLFVCAGDDQLKAFQAISDYLRAYGHTVSLWPASDTYPEDFRVVTTIPHTLFGLPLQVVVTSAHTFQELLDNFDITTHMVGFVPIDGGVRVVFGEKHTPATEQPRVVQFGSPHRAMERLDKVCARFGFPPHPEDLKQLEAVA